MNDLEETFCALCKNDPCLPGCLGCISPCDPATQCEVEIALMALLQKSMDELVAEKMREAIFAQPEDDGFVVDRAASRAWREKYRKDGVQGRIPESGLKKLIKQNSKKTKTIYI